MGQMLHLTTIRDHPTNRGKIEVTYSMLYITEHF